MNIQNVSVLVHFYSLAFFILALLVFVFEFPFKQFSYVIFNQFGPFVEQLFGHQKLSMGFKMLAVYKKT